MQPAVVDTGAETGLTDTAHTDPEHPDAINSAAKSTCCMLISANKFKHGKINFRGAANTFRERDAFSRHIKPFCEGLRGTRKENRAPVLGSNRARQVSPHRTFR